MYSFVDRIINGGPKLNLHLGLIKINPSVSFVLIFVLLLFFLVLTLAQVRRHFMDWSFKGSFYGFFLGFALAIIIEAFFVLGQKDMLTSFLNSKNLPKPFSTLVGNLRGRATEQLCR
jgi:hypothetical protein